MDDKVARGRTRNQYVDATHCIYGHLLSDDNVYINPSSGSRQCRTCRREGSRLEKRISPLSPEERKVARREFWAEKKAATACGLKVRYP